MIAALLLALAPAAGPGIGSTQACPAPDPAVPKRQFRAMWIASVQNRDWPSAQGLPVEEQKAEYVRLLDAARRLRLNAVVVQIRPTADAFWPSPSEPWSQWLTGAQGRHPGYDPLAFLVREAHARDLEFHAWFNPYRVSMEADPGRLSPGHPGRRHPDWIVPYGGSRGRLFYNPGIPAARHFIENAILDAVRRYDVDGVHFDDYFYPYPNGSQEFADDAAYARYGAGFSNRARWRRHNVDLLVAELSRRITAVKPWVTFGIAPFAVWRNRAVDPRGSDTATAATAYDDLYADTRKWVREEWVDYVAPTVFWNIGFAAADYATLVRWWSALVAGTGVQLFIGQATYKAGTSIQDPAWSDPEELTRHLTFNRDYPQVRGDVYFSATDVLANHLDNMGILAARHYRRPALVPVMPRLGGRAPSRPALLSAREAEDGIRLAWLDSQRRSRPSTSFAIYRFDGSRRVDRCDLGDAAHLLATVRATRGPAQGFIDPAIEPGRRYTYAVTALDRRHHESPPAQASV